MLDSQLLHKQDLLASTIEPNKNVSPGDPSLHQMPTNSGSLRPSMATLDSSIAAGRFLSMPDHGTYGFGNDMPNFNRMYPSAFGGMRPLIAGMGPQHLAVYGGMKLEGPSENPSNRILKINGMLLSLNQMKQRLLDEQLQGMTTPGQMPQLEGICEPWMPSCTAASDMLAAAAPNSELDMAASLLLNQRQALRSMLTPEMLAPHGSKRARGEDESEEEGGKRKRRKKSAHQAMMLRDVFRVNPRPSKMCIAIVAQQTHLSYQEVSRWFRNERHKSKKNTSTPPKEDALLGEKAELSPPPKEPLPLLPSVHLFPVPV